MCRKKGKKARKQEDSQRHGTVQEGIYRILGCPVLKTLPNLEKRRIYKAYSTFTEIAKVS